MAGFLNFESPCDGAQRHSLFEKAHYKCVKVYRGKTASFSARSFCTYVSSLDSWGLLGQDSARIYYRTAKYRVGKILVGMPIPRRFSFLGDSGDRGSSYIPTFGTCLNILFATNIDLQVRIDISWLKPAVIQFWTHRLEKSFHKWNPRT